jgi:hypothetical protein
VAPSGESRAFSAVLVAYLGAPEPLGAPLEHPERVETQCLGALCELHDFLRSGLDAVVRQAQSQLHVRISSI